MPIRDLKAQIARLPEQPGVYLYSNEAGETLYVGKARVLRDRVRSYLGAQGMSPRIDALLDEAQRLEVIVTDSVVEALALENHLIKARGPKYNILLRDDKNYPYLQLTVGEPFPRVLIARSVERDDHFYAGPFLPTKLARRTMSLTHRLFGMRSCNETITGGRGRPCLEYDIKRCIAPCVRELCSEEEYRVAVDHTKLFLEGRSDELVAGLRDRMTEAAAAERFEQAAQLRDAIRTIETQRTRQQKMAGVELGDRDAFGLKLGPAGAVVQIFQMRGGRVIERIELASELGTTFDAGPGALPKTDGESEVLQAALQQFYADRPAPPEVHLPLDFSEADTEMLEGWLTAQAGHRVRLMAPKRGEKRGLLDLAARNAEVAYQARFNENVAAHYDALETLRGVLALAGVPRRIECFDISTIQGAETVASMVVCEDGRMKRSEYRKFRIRGNTTVGSRRSGVGSQSGVGSRQSVVSRESSPGLESSAGSPSPESVVSRESSPGLESSAGSPSPESVGSRESSPGLESSAGSPSPESVGSRESSPGLESSAGSPSPESVGSRESSPGLESSAGSPSPESVGSRESSPGLESSAGSPSPDSGLPSPEPRAPSPESRAPSPESRAPSPESRSPIPDPRVPGSDARFLDDFASMHEVVLRRYRKLLETGGAFPDLVLIDGGKGQLSAAYAALEELGLGSLVAVGIAKKEELLFTRDRDDAIALAHESPALLLIQRIRDEAHRFAVTFHRQQRKTRDLRSELDEIAGIGPRRRKALLTVFGSVAGVRRAARDDLARVIGVKGADAVLSHFNSRT